MCLFCASLEIGSDEEIGEEEEYDHSDEMDSCLLYTSRCV